MNKIKRRYLDLRNGWQVLGILFSFGNFIMISHLALKIQIQIQYYALIISPALIIGLVIIGHYFRKKQLSTDMNLNYEKASEAGKTTYFIMKAQFDIMKTNNIPIPEGFEERMNYMKAIGDQKST